jgi:hypothetical protein
MLIKQTIINDDDIKSVFSIRFATRRPRQNGFRVEPNEVRYRIEKTTMIKSVFSIRFATRRPRQNGFRVELEHSESSYRENHFRSFHYALPETIKLSKRTTINDDETQIINLSFSVNSFTKIIRIVLSFS